MDATNQDQQRAAVRTALIFVQVLSPSAASCDDRGVLERLQHRSLQSADSHMQRKNIVKNRWGTKQKPPLGTERLSPCLFALTAENRACYHFCYPTRQHKA